MITLSEQLTLAKQFMLEGIAKADLAVFDAVLDPNITVITGLSPAGPIVGLEQYKQVFSGFADAWPVKEFILDDLFGVQDKVVARFTATCVFKKDYYGVPATQQIVPLKEVHILSFQGDKIVESIVSGTNFPFEYIMYPALRDLVIGNLPIEEE